MLNIWQAFAREAAARFDAAVSSVVKLMQRYRATGSVAPAKTGGHRKRILLPHRDLIQERLKATPHLSLHALKVELGARGVAVSHNAVWVFLRREGLRFKKNDARSRTGAPGRRKAPAALEGAAGKI
jgi:transposase